MPRLNSRIEPGEVLLTTHQYAEKYKVAKSTQCRHRRDGSGPSFIVANGRILYPEQEVLKWLSDRVVQSSAELPINRNGNRYKHLPAAREKARRLAQESGS